MNLQNVTDKIESLKLKQDKIFVDLYAVKVTDVIEDYKSLSSKADSTFDQMYKMANKAKSDMKTYNDMFSGLEDDFRTALSDAQQLQKKLTDTLATVSDIPQAKSAIDAELSSLSTYIKGINDKIDYCKRMSTQTIQGLVK